MAKIGLNLFFILSVSCLASKAFGKASAESLYESLSWRIDYVIRDVNNLRSELMETKSVVNRLESKIEKIEENATATIIGTNKNEEKISQSIINDKIKAVEERTESFIKNQIKRQKVAVMKILFENKKLMREKVQNFESKFIMFTSDIKFQMELMNASMESSVDSLEQSMTEHKIDTNSSLVLMNASIKNSVESLEQSMNEHKIDTISSLMLMNASIKNSVESLEQLMNEHKIDTNSSLMLMNADSHDRLNETNLKLEVMRVEFQNMKDDSDTKIEMTKNEIENKMNSVLQNATSGINDRLNDAESRIRSMSSERQQVVNGRWSPWSSWSSCSVTCGVGMKERTRRCDNPAPSRLGQACIGSSEDKEICTMNKCPFSVRLVNGPHAFEGRLEVYHDGQWGTVCDDGFDNDAAKVVCRMLDFPGDVNLAEKYSAAHYGRGSLPILLDDVSCNGSELSITDCSHNAWSLHNCNHGKDVGVACRSPPVRLVDGPHRYEGRLEIYHNGEWGVVCDDSINDKAARVVCRMLNFPGDMNLAQKYSGAHYGEGSLPMLPVDVSCNGSELRITDCSQKASVSYNCSHREYVGVACHPLSVRLVNGPHAFEGRLEVYNDGQWWTVCDDGFDNDAAKVVCRMLNFSGDVNLAEKYSAAHYGRGSLPILLDDVSCDGSELSITECSHHAWSLHDCNHGEDVGVACRSPPVRLVDGPHRYEGRLEIYHNGEWGAVCDDSINDNAARVVCRMLNFPGDMNLAHKYKGAHYGEGSLPILPVDVSCNGSELRITDCSQKALGSYSCSHREYVGVACHPPPVRLVDGPHRYEGRLEIYHKGKWEAVCGDSFNDNAARVVCRMLNPPGDVNLAQKYAGAHYGERSLPALLDDVSCNGSELSITDCSHSAWGSYNCSYKEYVGVACHPPPVRLVDGPHWYEGRLEIYHKGEWGTVCDDSFSDNAARVVCRMLNFSRGVDLAQKYSGAHYGLGSLPILLDDVNCKGSEFSITDCSHVAWGSHSCNHGEDVGVTCLPSPVRLVDGLHWYEGRLEIYQNEEWGVVCNDSINDNVARVVCRMLNFPADTEPHVVSTATYGEGSVHIHLDDVNCDGTESDIFDCLHVSSGSEDCHSEDVGVSCVSGLAVRLAGGSLDSGRLEMSLDGSTWGTVCDDDFNNNSAKVVCRMLGLPLTSASYYTAGGGSGRIYLDNVDCNGTESSLLSCYHREWGQHNCGHTEDVGVRCPP